MTNAELRALAARVKTEEPSRELDADIWEAFGLTEAEEDHARTWCRGGGKHLTRRHYLLAWSPAFTTSHDAAFAAMPAGFDWIMARGKTRPDEPMFGMRVFRDADPDTVVVEIEDDDLCRLIIAASLLTRAVDAEHKGQNA